jgi:hypothetical protein
MSEQQPEKVTAPPQAEQQQATTTPAPAKPLRQPNYGLFFTVIVTTVSAFITYLAPSPFKEWGGAGLLASLGVIVLFRTAEQFLGTPRARATLPYSIATFLVVTPVAVWGQGIYHLVGLVVYFVIVGVALFYWLIKMTVDRFQHR